MKYIQKILQNFKLWFSKSYNVKQLNDFPEPVEPKIIYVVGTAKQAWLIVFICPCGCNETIQLNLLREARPRWNFKLNWNNTITINPSVRRSKGCKSHFNIRNSKVVWW